MQDQHKGRTRIRIKERAQACGAGAHMLASLESLVLSDVLSCLLLFMTRLQNS